MRWSCDECWGCILIDWKDWMVRGSEFETFCSCCCIVGVEGRMNVG